MQPPAEPPAKPPDGPSDPTPTASHGEPTPEYVPQSQPESEPDSQSESSSESQPDHEPEPEPLWSRLLLPTQPRMGHFMLSAMCLLLPVAAMGLGRDWIIPAMALSATLGGGLGIGWLLACARIWLSHAAVISTMVFVMSIGCLGHLYIMPRWEVWLRAQDTIYDMRRGAEARTLGREVSPPTYNAGEQRYAIRLVPVGEDPPAGGVLAYTPQLLQRWTPFGYRDSCGLVLYNDGRVKMVRTRMELLAETTANDLKSANPE